MTKPLVLNKDTMLPIGVVMTGISLLVGAILWLTNVQSQAANAKNASQNNKVLIEKETKKLQDDIKDLAQDTAQKIADLSEDIQNLSDKTSSKIEKLEQSNVEKLKLLYKQQADTQVLLKSMERLQKQMEQNQKSKR